MNDHNDYLDFEENSQIPNSATNAEISNKTIEDEQLNLTAEDFAKLARQASGLNAEVKPLISDSKIKETSSEKETTSPVLGLRRPYIKILAGVVMTSLIVVALIALRGSWLKITNLKPEQKSSPKSSANKYKNEIDKLKAELALMEQSKKPIIAKQQSPPPKPKPEPPLKPKSSPQPKPKPAKPKPILEPEPIDPYEQWAMLAQLGTLGNSALALAANSGKNTIPPDSNKSSEVTISSTRNQPNANQNKIKKTQPLVQNKEIETVILNPPSSTKQDSPFPPDTRNVILNGLGLSPISSFDSQPMNLTTSYRGLLATTIAWTPESDPQEIRGSITLEEPLKYANGKIAIPKDSSIIVQVTDWDNSGFVTLEAIAISYKQNGKLKQRVLPSRAFTIRNEHNQPLAFKSQNLNGVDLLNNLTSNLAQGGIKSLPLPKPLGSTVSRAISDSSRFSAKSQSKLYLLEAQTPVLININHTLLNL